MLKYNQLLKLNLNIFLKSKINLLKNIIKIIYK